MKVEMFSTQKGAMPLSFSDFDFFADLQGGFGRFANLALCVRFSSLIAHNERTKFLAPNIMKLKGLQN